MFPNQAESELLPFFSNINNLAANLRKTTFYDVFVRAHLNLGALAL